MSFDELQAFFESDPIAVAITERIAAIKAKIKEYEEEIRRLNKKSTEFTFTGASNADYYINKAIHRENEQRLMSEKLELTRKITELKFKLIPSKPKSPLFE